MHFPCGVLGGWDTWIENIWDHSVEDDMPMSWLAVGVNVGRISLIDVLLGGVWGSSSPPGRRKSDCMCGAWKAPMVLGGAPPPQTPPRCPSRFSDSFKETDLGGHWLGLQGYLGKLVDFTKPPSGGVWGGSAHPAQFTSAKTNCLQSCVLKSSFGPEKFHFSEVSDDTYAFPFWK